MSSEPKDWDDLELFDSGASLSSTLFDDEFDDEYHHNLSKTISSPSSSSKPRALHSLLQRLTPRWLPLRPIRYHSLTPSSHRHIGVSWTRLFFLFIATIPTIIVILILFAGIFIPSYTHLPTHYSSLARRIQASPISGRGNINNEKVFIAASIYDEKGELASGAWGQALQELIDILGQDNVFLSIYENDPSPIAKEELRSLEQRVSCNSSIVSEHLDTAPLAHVTLPSGEQRLKRIAYLAEVRNRALLPLDDPTSPAYSIQFDKLLYLNDVVYNPIDAANLLFSTHYDETTGKTRYNAACAVDFSMPFKFYDTFATRDLEGYSMGIPFYPWFGSAGKAESRHDVLSQKDAVRVRSCWGGMVAFEAKWFQKGGGKEAMEDTDNATVDLSKVKTVSTSEPASSSTTPATTIAPVDYHPEVDKNLNWGLTAPNTVVPAEPTETAEHNGNLNWHWATDSTRQPPSSRSLEHQFTPIRFRATTDTFWDASECCLIHADLEAARGLDVSDNDGIFMNPYVRVAYDTTTLSWLAFTRRFERLYPLIHYILNNAVGLPGYNPRRTEESGDIVVDRVWKYNDTNYLTSGNLNGSFQDVQRTAEPGGFCGGRKMLGLGEGEERGQRFSGKVPLDVPA